MISIDTTKLFLLNFVHFMWVCSNNIDLGLCPWKTCSKYKN